MAIEPSHQIVPSVLTVRTRSARERFILWITRQQAPDVRGVYAHLASGPARRAMVFVHGFGGEALQTWTRFPDLLAAEPEVADCDLIFYDYDSLSQQLGSMATPFMRFMRELSHRPSRMLNHGLSHWNQRPAGFQYEEILIVAHSLGAVVTRRALLDAQGNRETWVARTRFVLFAPADCGASKVPLVSESLAGVPFGSLGSGAIKFTIPVLAELEPGSDGLQRLLDDTKELTAGGRAGYLLAKRVLWASDESVTRKMKFIVHEFADEIPGTSHTSVCKPRPGKTDALDHVLRAVRGDPP